MYSCFFPPLFIFSLQSSVLTCSSQHSTPQRQRDTDSHFSCLFLSSPLLTLFSGTYPRHSLSVDHPCAEQARRQLPLGQSKVGTLQTPFRGDIPGGGPAQGRAAFDSCGPLEVILDISPPPPRHFPPDAAQLSQLTIRNGSW